MAEIEVALGTIEKPTQPETSGDVTGYVKLANGVAAVAALNKAKEEEFNNRPVCCGKQTVGFDEIAWICEVCQTTFE